MEVVRLLTRRFEDLVTKYKTVLSQTETEPPYRDRPEHRIQKDGKIVLELKRRSPDADG